MVVSALVASVLAMPAVADGKAPPEPDPVAQVQPVAVLRNGFHLEYARREIVNSAVRLWLSPGGGSGYIDIPADQIARYEEWTKLAPELAPVTPAPAKPSSLPSREPAPAARTADPAAVREEISQAARRYQIDPDFVEMLVQAESDFHVKAVSPKGARGLMQLMPDTAARLGVTDPFDAAGNLDAGTRHLRALLDQYDGDAVKALAAYNAGAKRVQQYGGVPPYRETRAYVARIAHNYNRRKHAEKSQAK
ncbi:MAG: transglycosylase SLT domain-containing protein [Acidobacteria bacterium]|nr:transglycosylase SLT domain-containing protein [Acidobacteriota bacterium]